MFLLKTNTHTKIVFLLGILLCGCQVGPRYCPPEMETPCEWHSTLSEGMQDSASECFVWWEALHDPVLSSLLERASTQNIDLHLAATRILEARAERKGACSNYYPHIDGSIGAGNLHQNSRHLINDVLCTESDCSTLNANFFEIGFDADWEIDLFGVGAHERNAINAKIEASYENYCDLWVTLSAEIARNYIELRALQQRLNITTKSSEAQKNIVSLTHDLQEQGITDTISLHQAEEQLHHLMAERPLICLSIDKTIFRLSLLLGYPPGELFAELETPAPLPELPFERPIVVPSEVLRERPDVRRAERELAAATERVGSAIASLFPRVSLQGFVGNISSQLSSLFNSASFTAFSSGQLLVPIFNSSMIKQDIDLSKIKTCQALYEYQKTVLKALEEGEIAIASFHYELERNRYLAGAHSSNQDNYALMLQLYERGLKSYVEVETINRSMLDAENARLQSQQELLMHYISLYKAFGGGCWQ